MSAKASINPEMLTWARKRWGIGLAEAASKLGIQGDSRGTGAERLQRFESGEHRITQLQLENIAKRYRLPITLFYMSDPPPDSEPVPDYRLFPDSGSPPASGALKALLTEIQGKQEMVRTLLLAKNNAIRTPISAIRPVKADRSDVAATASHMKHLLHEDEDSVWGKARDSASLFRELRSRVEQSGIFVVLVGSHMSGDLQFSEYEFRGIALWDDVAPFIIINGLDAPPAQVFTLMHELAHIIRRTSGVSNMVGTHEQILSTEEQHCNQSAATFLLPTQLFPDSDTELSYRKASRQVDHIARSRHVSKMAIAIRLFHLHRIGRDTLAQLLRTYRGATSHEANATTGDEVGEAGPIYYPMKVRTLGHRLIREVGEAIDQNLISYTKAATILGVKAPSVLPLVRKATKVAS